ncbi:MAG: exopolyphosphatase, partial [Chitinophagaceae bacterium]
MRYAAIDIGTNTFHLIIADGTTDGFTVIHKENLPVKLGEGSINQGFINDAAMARAMAAFSHFREQLDKFKVKNVRAVATSAVRSAINGQDFVEAVKDATGIDIEVIDGDEEAELIYEGVKLSGAITGKSLIMDIGGGSTEFILCDEENLIWKKSYNIG